MRYFVLATDYDGTLATDGHVNDATLDALKRLRTSGRRLVLVTGRELDDLQREFPHLDLFDYAVVENGAVIYCPATRTVKLLGEAPPEGFVQALRAKNVDPLSAGKVIVATWHPNEDKVLETIRELGLELQVIFNKGAVMVLPSGINKAAGLKAALEEMKVSPHNVVAVGDAENDHAFMNISECSVAVANALPSLKDRVDFVTEGSRGDGVIELIDKLIASDLSELDEKLKRENIHVGKAEDDVEISIKPYGTSALLAGTSGGGKSTLATGIIERIAEAGYQFCIIDPEGDYENFDGAVILGDADRAPSIDEIQSILEQPNQNLIINLLGVGLHDRPKFFAELLPALLELRSRTGRPHWIIVDEAHHLLPASLNTAAFTLPQQLNGLMMITVHPDHVAPAAVSLVNTLLTVGQAPENNIKLFCETVGDKVPELSPQKLEKGQALIWYRGGTPQRFHFTPGHTERRRHVRKYAEGQLGEDKSFYFKGKEGKLNLRAQNLILFTQIAEGVDDDTWLYHLHEGDYSQWFREAIKDNSLAEEVEEIEKNANGSASDSRQAIKAAIEERYTLPA